VEPEKKFSNSTITDENKLAFLDHVCKNLAFFMPLPDNSYLFIKAGLDILNLALSQAIPISNKILVGGAFSYDISDITWTMYPDDYFEKNLWISPAEYNQIISLPGE